MRKAICVMSNVSSGCIKMDTIIHNEHQGTHYVFPTMGKISQTLIMSTLGTDNVLLFMIM